MHSPAPENAVAALCSAALFFAMDHAAIIATWKHMCFMHVGPAALGPSAGKFNTLLLGPAAVAAAVVGHPAVVGPEGEQIPVALLNLQF